MIATAISPIPECVVPRMRILKGTIYELLDELIDTCSEEGVPCKGFMLKQLAGQVEELEFLCRLYPNKTEVQILPDDLHSIARIAEELEGPEVDACELQSIQRDFRRLLQSVLES